MKDVCATKEMTSSSDCPKCKNTGWIYDKSTNTCKKCDCYEKLILANRREFADFPISFLSTTLRNFNQSIYDKKNTFLVSEALKMIKLYLEDFEKQKEEGLGFYIWSNAKGSGKTRLAISIANELLEKHNCRVKFATSVAILNEIKSTWNDKEEKIQMEQKLKEIFKAYLHNKADINKISKSYNISYNNCVLLLFDCLCDWMNGKDYIKNNVKKLEKLTDPIILEKNKVLLSKEKIYKIHGEELKLAEISQKYNIDIKTLRARLRQGMSINLAIAIPVRKRVKS